MIDIDILQSNGLNEESYKKGGALMEYTVVKISNDEYKVVSIQDMEEYYYQQIKKEKNWK